MGHYYDEQGKPQHFQTVKSGVRKGKLRPSTITDARKLKLRPSVTGVTEMLYTGEGLTQWKIREAIKKLHLKIHSWFCQSEDQLQFIEDFNVDMDYVERDYAAGGRVIHDKIETWIEAGMPTTECPYCLAAKEIFEKYGIQNPIAEATFSTDDYGGAVDIHDKVAKIVLDWKTKDGDLFEKEGKSFVFVTHPMQLAAYREGLEMPEDTRLVNVFLSRTHAGTWCDYEHNADDTARGWAMFKGCLNLWKLKNRWHSEKAS